MNKLSNWFLRISSGWVALIYLVVFLVFVSLVLPDQAEKAGRFSPDSGSPDTSFFYNARELYTFAESYGPKGRAAYIHARLTFDVIWPLVYTAFLITAISWLTHQTSLSNHSWGKINLIPLAAITFDFLENIAAATVMARYPEPTPILATLAGWFTAVKWILLCASFIFLLVSIGYRHWEKRQKEKTV